MPVETCGYCINCGREMIVKTTPHCEKSAAYKALQKTYRFDINKRLRFEVIYECQTCGHKTLLVITPY